MSFTLPILISPTPGRPRVSPPWGSLKPLAWKTGALRLLLADSGFPRGGKETIAPSHWADSFLHLPACLCSEAVWPTCPMGLVWVIKVQGVERKFHLDRLALPSVSGGIPKIGVDFGLAFQRAFGFRRAAPAGPCKANGASPVDLGRIGISVAWEGKLVTLFSFCSSPEEIPPGVKSVMSVSFRGTAAAQLRICKQVSGQCQSLRSAFFSAESLFPCMELWWWVCTREIPSWNHFAHRRQSLSALCQATQHEILVVTQTSCCFQCTLSVSPCGTMCNVKLLNPAASWGREERWHKTTAWVIVGGRTGTRDFLGRLPAFTSPSAAIISSVLDLSYSHASAHLNAFFFEIVCLGVVSVLHFRLLMMCCLQWNAHWYTVNHEEMQRHPFVTTNSVSMDFWNGLPVKLWGPSLEKTPILCGSLIFLFLAASHAGGCLTSLGWT